MTQCRISRRDFLAASFGSTMVLPTLSAREGETRRLLMIAGTPSHGPGDHEFNAGTTLLKKCLDRAGIPGLTTILQLNGWPKDESVFHGVHAIFLYCDGGGGHPFIQKNRLQLIGDLMKQGVGLMCAHYAVEVPKDRGGPEFKEWIGGYYEHQYSVNPIWVPRFEQLPDHPICRGVEPFAIRDGKWKLCLCAGSGGWSWTTAPSSPCAPVSYIDFPTRVSVVTIWQACASSGVTCNNAARAA